MPAPWRSPATTPERRRAETAGRRAERLAAWLLGFKGYRTLARRARTPAGEIDLVVRRGGMVVFVEVKARPSLDQAAEAIGPAARARIAGAAAAWIAAHPRFAGLDMRFDAMLFAPRRWPRHIVDAFGVDGRQGL
jgi:putative endonuclease